MSYSFIKFLLGQTRAFYRQHREVGVGRKESATMAWQQMMAILAYHHGK